MVRRLRQRLEISNIVIYFYIDETVRQRETRLNQPQPAMIKEEKSECLQGISGLTLVLPMC
jgi:hypothetical protein